MNNKIHEELESIINDLSEVSNMGELEFQQNDKKGAVSRLKALKSELPNANTNIHGSGTGGPRN
jgi:hypothetical protein